LWVKKKSVAALELGTEIDTARINTYRQALTYYDINPPCVVENPLRDHRLLCNWCQERNVRSGSGAAIAYGPVQKVSANQEAMKNDNKGKREDKHWPRIK
jgi:hypothetical protein